MNIVGNYKRLVIKIGSALLVDANSGTLRQKWLNSLCQDISELKKLAISKIKSKGLRK